MEIRITNCSDRLYTNFGIDMERNGSCDKLIEELDKFVTLRSLAYYFVSDIIEIEIEDTEVLPDLSLFGEVDSIVAST